MSSSSSEGWRKRRQEEKRQDETGEYLILSTQTLVKVFLTSEQMKDGQRKMLRKFNNVNVARAKTVSALRRTNKVQER